MRLYMRDYLTLDLKNADTRLIQCDAAGENSSLLVHVAATHAAIVNGNARFYCPDKMQAGCGTWVDKEEYPRPVLLEHDEANPPVGRVLTAKYVDLSYLYASDYPILKDSIFYCSDAKKRMNKFETVDWIVDNLMPLKGYKGLGYIDLGMKITEPEAIKRVLRKEYLTVSVGFATDSACCSICHQDWATEDRCDHQLGRKYDDKRCYVISGAMDFNECSWVNAPADPFATVISLEQLTDSRNRAFFFGLPLQEQHKRLDTSGLVLTDAVISADIDVVEDTPEMTDLKAINAELKKADLTAERALAIQKELNTFAPSTDSERKTLKKAVSTVTAKIKANGWDAQSTPETTVEDATNASVQVTPEERAALEAEATGKPVENTDAQTSAPVAEAGSPQAAPTPAAEVQLSDAVKTVLAAVEMKDANEEVVGVVKSLDAKWSGLGDSERRYLRYAVGALISTWYAKEDLDMYLGWLTKDSDSVVLSKTEHNDFVEAVAKFGETEKQLKDSIDTEASAKLTFLKQAKDALATQIVMYKVLTGVKGYTQLTADQLQDKIKQRATKDLKSLLAVRAEILEELQWATPVANTDAASPKTAPEPAGLEVSDSAQVEPPVPTPDASQGTVPQTDSVETPVEEPPVDLKFMSRQERQQYEATKRFQKRVTTK